MSIVLKKRPGDQAQTPSPMHLTFFVDENGNPSLKNSEGVITPATNAGGPVQLNEQLEAPDPVAGAVKIYSKDVGGKAELFSRDDSGNETQITSGGLLNSNVTWRWKDDIVGNLHDSTNTVPTLVDVKQRLIDPLTSLSGEGDKEGVVVSAGDRVLRMCALTETEDQVANGIYVVQVGDWTRAVDADTGEKIQDAIVEMPAPGETPPEAERFAFWNPSGIPITVNEDPQNWVVMFDWPLEPSYEVYVVAVNNITLSGTQTIDGVSLSEGQEVLVTNQTNPIDNGVWEVQTGAWARDEIPEGTYLSGGVIIKITSGTLYSGRKFILNHPINRGVIVGVDPQYWTLLDTEDLEDWGPVRVDVNFGDVVPGRSPFMNTPSNAFVILTLPLITPENAGKKITFVSYESKTAKKKFDVENLMVVAQPAEDDTVGGMGPGETALIWQVQSYNNGPIELVSDGAGVWLVNVAGLGGPFPYEEIKPTPPTP